MSLYLGKEKIENISCGMPATTSGTNTSDATATASDILSGKTAYVKGQKITGNIDILNSITEETIPTINNTFLELMNDGNEGYLVTDAPITLKTPLSNLGDALASDVASGKTFTSSAGLKVTGTATTSSSPDGIDTTNATATASDILSGKTAYVNGSKITGTISTLTSPSTITATSTESTTTTQGKYIQLTGKMANTGYVNSLTTIKLRSLASNFGTATAADVAAGKTFTSSAGFKVTGTASSSSSSSPYGVFMLRSELNADVSTINTTYNWTKPSKCTGSILALIPVFTSQNFTGDFVECLTNHAQLVTGTQSAAAMFIYEINLFTKICSYFDFEKLTTNIAPLADFNIVLTNDQLTLDGNMNMFLMPCEANSGFIVDYMVIYK